MMTPSARAAAATGLGSGPAVVFPSVNMTMTLAFVEFGSNSASVTFSVPAQSITSVLMTLFELFNPINTTPFLIAGNFCPGTEYVRAGEVYGLSGKKNLRQRGSTLPEAENSMKRRWGGVPAAQCFSAASITPSSSRVVSAACSQYMTPSRPFSIAYTHLRRTASGDSKLMKSLPFQR